MGALAMSEAGSGSDVVSMKVNFLFHVDMHTHSHIIDAYT